MLSYSGEKLWEHRHGEHVTQSLVCLCVTGRESSCRPLPNRAEGKPVMGRQHRVLGTGFAADDAFSRGKAAVIAGSGRL